MIAFAGFDSGAALFWLGIGKAGLSGGDNGKPSGTRLSDSTVGLAISNGAGTLIAGPSVAWFNATGKVDPELAKALVELARDPANLMRGVHDCEFCDVESLIEIPALGGIGESVYLGNGEIRVAGDGSIGQTGGIGLGVHAAHMHA